MISIHALREEGDFVATFILLSIRVFLSTPSARRATWPVLAVAMKFLISIHALREEGDWPLTGLLRPENDFYPRPPRGGRRQDCEWKVVSVKFLSTPSARRATFNPSSWASMAEYFYPRPPRGGRQKVKVTSGYRCVFLSTPSARRATLSVLVLMLIPLYFYPRPPRGGRLSGPVLVSTS